MRIIVTPRPRHIEGADIWNCPCRECTRLEWELHRMSADKPRTLRNFRAWSWPDHYPTEGNTP